MSGHSKWATIKRSKAATDAKRGKAFTKVAKEIIQAAKAGGGNPDMNARLRTAVLAAKAVNMPQDNIKRAIMKGTGELAGESYDDLMYEAYGPGGVAILVEITTDNKNRTAAEIRSIFSKRNGSLGEPGSVAWMFEKKGQIVVKKESISEDDLMTLALDAGAEDITTEESSYTVSSETNEHEKVDGALKDKVEIISSEVTLVPKNVVAVEEVKIAESLLKLLDALEEQEDVQNVYSNFDIPDAVMDQMKTE
jgi:YebC/PmpR family DNA-binding regulatory protein